MLYIRPGVERELEPLRCGGTGTQSDEDRQPDVLPDKYEPGNHNLLGLAGLAAATEFLRDETDRSDPRPSHATRRATARRLREIEGVTIHGPQPTADRTSVVSITSKATIRRSWPPCSTRRYRIQCRAGLHCAPRMHDALGTTAGGGTLRFSPGYSTTLEEIDTVIDALQEVAASLSNRMRIHQTHDAQMYSD